MEKSMHLEPSPLKQPNGAIAKDGSPQAELSNLLSSFSVFASREVGDLIDSLSKSVPKETTQYLKRNWKVISLSATVAAVAGVSTYLLIQRFSTRDDRKMPLLN